MSDNATNFVGANNELLKLTSVVANEKIRVFLSDNYIQWSFIPARSPHFGGLWEAAVRATKYHLKRVAQNLTFTYEEFHTLLTQVECVLNSRPLIPMSSDPTDLEVLTPGHFLIGTSLKALPQEDLTDVPSNRLTRYQHLQQVIQHFWTRWSKDYLNTLQRRSQWKEKTTPIIPLGGLVLLKDDNLPPQMWRMGRVEHLHTGADGTVRVISVKTSHGVLKRAIRQVCLLPVNND